VSVLTMPAEYLDSVRPARVAAVAGFGFTERQARFLVTVMVHSGVFLERQYCAFAGISHGQKSHDLAAKLTARRFATAIAPGRLHQGRLFHIHYKPLYEAIGEPDNRHRKTVSLGRMIERLMILDGVLADRNYTWLGIRGRSSRLRHQRAPPSSAVPLGNHRRSRGKARSLTKQKRARNRARPAIAHSILRAVLVASRLFASLRPRVVPTRPSGLDAPARSSVYGQLRDGRRCDSRRRGADRALTAPDCGRILDSVRTTDTETCSARHRQSERALCPHPASGPIRFNTKFSLIDGC
jgi:hypothetical protein